MPKYELDAIDRRIIAELQRNGRLTNVELAERVGLSPSPCLRRVRMLEEQGAIQGYVALVDPAALGINMNVFVRVSLERQTEEYLDRFESAVRESPEIMECYLMTGDADYHLRVVVPDLATYEHFLKSFLTRIPGVTSIRSSFALKQISYTTALPVE